MDRTVSHEALGRVAGRIGTWADGVPPGRYLGQFLSEVEAKAAARKREIEVEVRRRWEESLEEIEEETAEYAMDNYRYWVEDAIRDYDDEDETPERRGARYATLGEWARAEPTDAETEGGMLPPRHGYEIAEHAEEVAESRLVREDDPDDLKEALGESITGRRWTWLDIRTASIKKA